MNRRCLIDGCPNHPTCSDRTVVFVTVPRDASLREKWLKLCRKSNLIKSSTVAQLCELHFTPELDFENLRFVRMVNGSVKLSKGACPSKFPWNDWGFLATNQTDGTIDASMTMDCLPTTPDSAPTCSTPIEMSPVSDSLDLPEAEESFSPLKRGRTDFENQSETDKALSDIFAKINVPAVKITDLMNSDSKTYLGVSKNTLLMILSASEKMNCKPRDILIVLMYIRLNEKYKLIGDQFSVSESAISKIFYKTVIKLAANFIPFIFWPDPTVIKLNLPMGFWLRYRNVQGIVDCFEIGIQKPDSAVAQSRTWSHYKNCNTTKYLINVTPHGFISFISHGFPGRVSDVEIFKNCGIIERIPDGAAIMVDRGFRNVGEFVASKNVQIICPPSLRNRRLSREEVITTKTIASLRINVERIIGQLRNFSILKGPINNKMLDVMDSVVIIVSGLVNLQKKII